MADIKHTPTPLQQNGCQLSGPDGRFIGTVLTGEIAGEIIRAFNAHDELVKALEHTRGRIEALLDEKDVDDDGILAEIDAALAKAVADV